MAWKDKHIVIMMKGSYNNIYTIEEEIDMNWFLNKTFMVVQGDLETTMSYMKKGLIVQNDQYMPVQKSRVSMDSDGAYTDYNMMSHNNGLGWSRWEKPGDIATHPQPKMNGNNDAHMLSTRYLEDGSYFRLKNVTLSYDFPQAWMKKAKMQGLKVYVSGDNLVTVSKFSGMDPEIDTEDGTYDTNYPVPMTVVGGIQITF